MASVTGKRKRVHVSSKPVKSPRPLGSSRRHPTANGIEKPTVDGEDYVLPGTDAELQHRPASRPEATNHDGPVNIQIVTGSYERVLHGFSASIPSHLLDSPPTEASNGTPSTGAKNTLSFSDTFLFAAHASSIRCLAVSPPTEADKRLLATGGSDERINVYSLSTRAPGAASGERGPALPSLSAATRVAENRLNRSLGSLVHHDRALTGLHFASKSKLFSAAEDNTIAIARTRDWTVLSSIKAPIPTAHGRPSGDTAAPGETPAGINSFAIHPSQKLMLSVGRGERCMRLWNLMTGKKAGVLSFDRDLLALVGEGKHATGEGRQVLWDATGDSFVVGFERGAAVFGVDSKPRAIIRPAPNTRLHRMLFLPPDAASPTSALLAVSTDDGRILFFDSTAEAGRDTQASKLPQCRCLAQLGGEEAGVSGRIKDFEVVRRPGDEQTILIVTGSSDGAVRLWVCSLSDLSGPAEDADGDVKLVGTLIGALETGNRITCLGAFVLDGAAGADVSADPTVTVEEDVDSEDSG